MSHLPGIPVCYKINDVPVSLTMAALSHMTPLSDTKSSTDPLSQNSNKVKASTFLSRSNSFFLYICMCQCSLQVTAWNPVWGARRPESVIHSFTDCWEKTGPMILSALIAHQKVMRKQNQELHSKHQYLLFWLLTFPCHIHEKHKFWIKKYSGYYFLKLPVAFYMVIVLKVLLPSELRILTTHPKLPVRAKAVQFSSIKK